MKDCCRNCHFLAQKIWWNSLTVKYEPVSLERRTNKNADSGLCCFHGEWHSSEPKYKESDNLSEFIDQPGRDCFWPQNESMSFEAGAKRQTKEIEDERTRKNHRLMKIGIAFSAIAAVSGIVYMIELISTWSN